MTEPSNRPGQSGFDPFSNQARIASIEEQLGPTGGRHTATSAPLNFFIDGVNGSDLVGDGSEGAPYQTMARVVPQIPFEVNHRVTLTFAPGTITTPQRYEWTHIPAKILKDFIYFRVDETKPGAFVEQYPGSLSLTALADTTGRVVKTTGLAVDATAPGSIEFLDGNAAGERRTIRDNDATDITPCEGWDTGVEPAEGDSYRIWVPGVVFEAPNRPANVGVSGVFQWVGGNLEGAPKFKRTTPLAGGYLFVNVSIGLKQTGNRFFSNIFGQSVYGLFGMVFTDEVEDDFFVFTGRTNIDIGVDTSGTFGIAFPELPLGFFFGGNLKWLGWGLSNFDLNGPTMDDAGGFCAGYIRCQGRVNTGVGEYSLLGGRTSLILIAPGNFGTHMRIFGSIIGFTVDAIPYLSHSPVSFSAALAVEGHGTLFARNVKLEAPNGVGSAALVVVRGKDTQVALLNVVGEAPSGRTVLVKNDAHLRIFEDPSGLGRAGAAMDWDINDGTPFDKSFFDTDLRQKFHNGSLIERDDSNNGFP